MPFGRGTEPERPSRTSEKRPQKQLTIFGEHEVITPLIHDAKRLER
jgi:hypothetical protein